MVEGVYRGANVRVESTSHSNDHCKDFRPYPISKHQSVTRPGTSQPVQGGLMPARKGLETTVADIGLQAYLMGVWGRRSALDVQETL